MQLLLDIGNTRMKASFSDNGILTDSYRGDVSVSSIEKFVARRTVTCGMWVSVRPLPADLEQYLTVMGLTQLTWRTSIPLRNLYSTPQTLGMDRLAAAVGAWSLKPGNDILIIDLGTAITYDLVNSNGEYLGGNISPGKELRFMSLHEHTGALPLVSHPGDMPFIGISTETAIRCGVVEGIKNEVYGFITRFRQQYPSLLVFLTGGDTQLLDRIEKKGTFVSENLVIQGLNSIIRYNEKD